MKFVCQHWSRVREYSTWPWPRFAVLQQMEAFLWNALSQRFRRIEKRNFGQEYTWWSGKVLQNSKLVGILNLPKYQLYKWCFLWYFLHRLKCHQVVKLVHPFPANSTLFWNKKPAFTGTCFYCWKYSFFHSKLEQISPYWTSIYYQVINEWVVVERSIRLGEHALTVTNHLTEHWTRPPITAIDEH